MQSASAPLTGQAAVAVQSCTFSLGRWKPETMMSAQGQWAEGEAADLMILLPMPLLYPAAPRRLVIIYITACANVL